MKSLIERFDKKHDTWKIFVDFLEIAAITLSNAVDLRNKKEREERYLQMIKPYTEIELLLFAEMIAKLEYELLTNPRDVLGELLMKMEFGNKDLGQAFTPIHLAELAAEISFDEKEIEERGFFTLNEPSAGGGVMIVALVNVMRKKGYNPLGQLLVVANDLDLKAVHMSYVQCSLLGIPAIINHQNTLTRECWSTWYTPMYVLGGWNLRRMAHGSN